MFSCKTKMTEKVANELLRPLLILAIVLTSVGGAGLLILSILLVFTGYLNRYLYLLATLMLVLGIAYFVLLAYGKHNNKRIMEEETIYEFYDLYFTLKSFNKGEEIASGKAYYKDMYRVRETASYIFVYPNKAIAYPIDKSELSAENLAHLRMIFKLPIPKM